MKTFPDLSLGNCPTFQLLGLYLAIYVLYASMSHVLNGKRGLYWTFKLFSTSKQDFFSKPLSPAPLFPFEDQVHTSYHYSYHYF